MPRDFDSRIADAGATAASLMDAFDNDQVRESHDVAGIAINHYGGALFNAGVPPKVVLAQMLALAAEAWYRGAVED